MRTLVIDYGMGNLGSAQRALEECGAEVVVSDSPDDLQGVERLVLPGVGAFADGMAQLHAGGWCPGIREALGNPEARLLGICLGMQLMADRSFEGGETPGLGLIAGDVRRLEPAGSDTRIPHIGWNEVHYAEAGFLFSNIPSGSDFYFVHSFHLVPASPEAVTAVTPYCGHFVSAVQRGNVMGVQFHPEKSGRAGLQLLRNFLSA
jgi:imidazole glycerol-phosphate synthase subunit HisH